MGDMYDVVILGFEPTSLSLVIALYESPMPLKILVLDRRERFNWSGTASSLPGSRMKTSLLQDLVTPRNPSSDFTFVNYLWSTGNLVDYTNLSLINPPKRIFSHYLRWAANKVEGLDLVRYSQVVSSVEPLMRDNQPVTAWRVTSEDTNTGTAKVVDARRLVVAVTPEPVLPAMFSTVQSLPSVFHASRADEAIAVISKKSREALNIAVLGGNEEAVEVFEHISSFAPQASVSLYPGEPTLRQTDDNPFLINAVQQPDRLPHELQEVLCTQFGTTKGNQTVDSTTISRLYLGQYTQMMKEMDVEKHKSRICSFKKFTGAAVAEGTARVQLTIENISTGRKEVSIPYDCVIVASGHVRTEHQRLLRGLSDLSESCDGSITIDSDYKVNMKRNRVATDAGVWILDGLDSQPQNAFLYLALRTERVLRSLLCSGNARVSQGTAAGSHGSRATL